MEETQSIFSNSSIFSFFENYGWYFLFGLILAFYVYEKYLKFLISDIKNRYEDEAYAAKYHKDPDLITSRLLAQEKRTQLLQEKYDKDADRYKEKQEERAQKKREELLPSDGGYRLGSRKDNEFQSFKPEYNPLMGAGSSSNYRPPKRSACSKGGCG